MKYLKTYEELTISEAQKGIENWMKENELTEVDLSGMDIHITQLRKIEFQMLRISGETLYYTNINRQPRKIGNSRWKFVRNKSLLNQILIYLNSLTPEEIEEQKAKQEADKFNF